VIPHPHSFDDNDPSQSWQLHANATCPGDNYQKGGRGLCGSLRHVSRGLSKCDKGYVYWCRHSLEPGAVFGSFEGGVSKMITMVWLNKMCNKER